MENQPAQATARAGGRLSCAVDAAPELKFAALSLIVATAMMNLPAPLGGFGRSSHTSSLSVQQLVSFQHKTVSDWIKKPDLQCLSLYAGYQFDNSLREAYKGLAALLLLCVYRHCNPGTPTELFRRDVAEQLLLMGRADVSRFLRLALPAIDVDVRTLDLMLLPWRNPLDDSKTRTSLIVGSGAWTFCARWARTAAMCPVRSCAKPSSLTVLSSSAVRCLIWVPVSQLECRLTPPNCLSRSPPHSTNKTLSSCLSHLRADCSANGAQDDSCALRAEEDACQLRPVTAAAGLRILLVQAV